MARNRPDPPGDLPGMGGGASKRAAQAQAQAQAQPQPQPQAQPQPQPQAQAQAQFELDQLDKELDELSDEELEPEMDPRLVGLDDANRQSWEMISNSLGMDNDDLLFNMLYFGDGTQNVGTAINNAMEETVALHSEHNTPYKLQPASQQDVQSLAPQAYVEALLSPRVRDCSVCREDLTPTCVVIKLPRCAHVFHGDCLTKWLTFQNWCPVCRQEVGLAAASAPTASSSSSSCSSSSPSLQSKVEAFPRKLFPTNGGAENNAELALAAAQEMADYSAERKDQDDWNR